MTLAPSVRAYFRVRPRGFVDGVRLFAAFVTSALLKAAIPARFRSVGLAVHGSRNLHVAVDGIEFEVRPRTNDLDLISPKHEPLTTDWFRVGANDIVVDVGAHIGRYTLKAAAAHKATVIAIEPDPSNFQLLEKNVRLNHRSNVVLVPQAMTAIPGSLLLSPGPSSNTGMSSVATVSSGELRTPVENRVSVPGQTLDHIVKAYGLSRIDWLKIDVEGHEVAVLEGAHTALEITRRLILEVTGSTDERCRRIVEGYGFGLVAVESGSPASTWLLTKS